MDYFELCRQEYEYKLAKEKYSRQLRRKKLEQRAKDKKTMGWFEYSTEYFWWLWLALFISGVLMFAAFMETSSY